MKTSILITSIAFILAITSCLGVDESEQLFNANEAKFEGIVNYTQTSDIIKDALKSNGDNIWIVNNKFPDFFKDVLILKSLNSLQVQRLDIKKSVEKSDSGFVILFYLKEGHNSIVWKSSKSINLPLRYSVKKQMKNLWYLVNFD